MREASIKIVSQALNDRVFRGRDRPAAEAYLKSLEDELRSLRQAYRSNTVSVDYTSQRIADAYLLGYCPQYIAAAHAAFATVDCSHVARALGYGRPPIVFVGGGPLPEIVGLAERLSECGLRRASLRVIVVDKHADSWRDTAEFSCGVARRILPGLEIELVTMQADFCDTDIAASIGTPGLVMFQNCLNEIGRGTAFIERISRLVDTIASNGLLVVSDLDAYEIVSARVAAVDARIRDRAVCLRDFGRTALESVPFGIVPGIVFWHFHQAKAHEGGGYGYPPDLAPRKNMTSAAVVWRKR